MSILIEGMELPKGKEITLRIDEAGEVYVFGSYPTELHRAVELPPHGRLIDADVLIEIVKRDTPLSDVFEKTILRYLENARTVIPAEPPKEEAE